MRRLGAWISAPGSTNPGTISETPIISTDFYPTLLALAGLPLRPKQHLDGIDVASLLTSGPVPARQTFYWHYPHYHGSTWAPGSAIRDDDWKLIEFLEENTVELYDLKDDVGERTNLAAENPERVKMLQAKLDAWRSKTGASMPKPNASAGAENIGTATNSKKK